MTAAIQSWTERGSRALTLIEVLVTVTVISILVTVTLASLAGARAVTDRTLCSNNLRQLIVGSLIYSQDDAHESYSGTLADQDDDLNWLYPSYVPSLRLFTCPGVRNKIRPDRLSFDPVLNMTTLNDLKDNAQSKLGFGTSYEVFGFMGVNTGQSSVISRGSADIIIPGVRKTANSVVQYQHRSSAFGLRGVFPGPSRIWLVLDADDHNPWNFPTGSGNHGSKGANVSFCDGHVEWVRRHEFAISYELSQDENRRE